MRRSQKKKAGLALVALSLLLALAFLWSPFWLHLRALSLLLDSVAEDAPGWLPPSLKYEVRMEEPRWMPGFGSGRSRLYLPVGTDRAPGVVLAHGVHRLGMDEPRLAAFARALASAGLVVFTPQLAELTAYRIEEPTVAAIGSAAEDLARRTGRATAGVIGISFTGGLALLAAADPEAGKHIGFVVCVGAHHDLRRVARYYTGRPIRDPKGRTYPIKPHTYGARVLLYAYLADRFPASELSAARQILEIYLHDRHRLARERAEMLNEPTRSRMLAILDQEDDQAIAEELDAILAKREAELLRVSPRGRLSGLRVPVFLLHGSDDPVIPSTETRWLERELPAGTLRRSLVTPLLRHAELKQRSTCSDYWSMVRFAADLLAAAHSQSR
jgi:dienelactone hydrolase